MSLTGLKRFFSWKKAYAIIFTKFQVISSHFDKLPYFTSDFPTNQIMDWDLDKGEILKTYKNEFDWLKTIFFMKKRIRDHFYKVSSDFKPFWQVTIFHIRLPHKPNHGLGLRQGWNSENLQKWVWMPQNDIFHEERHTRSFLQSFKCFQAILTSYHISHQTSHKPNHGLGLRQGWNSENLQKWVWMAQNDIFHERRHTRSFLQVSGDLKPFWKVTTFHTRLPHKPNHGLGLRQGWNSENLQKWVWMAQNDIFHEKRHTRSFLKSFKWFQAILTSYHISHQTSPQTKSWIGT